MRCVVLIIFHDTEVQKIILLSFLHAKMHLVLSLALSALSAVNNEFYSIVSSQKINHELWFEGSSPNLNSMSAFDSLTDYSGFHSISI